MNDNGTVNKVFLFGQVSRAPRLHKNGDGYSMLCFTLTTHDEFKQNGVMVEQVEDHAIRIAQNKLDHDIELGQLLSIEGKIKTSASVDDKGIKRYKTEIMALKVSLFSPKNVVKQAMSHSESNFG